MDVWPQTKGLVKRSNSDESKNVTGACVVAPNGDVALGTAGDLLALAAVGRRIHNFDFALQQGNSISFDHRVECK